MTKHLPFVVSTLSLLVGGMLYLGFRPVSLLMFEWINFVGLEGLVADYRAFILPYGSQLPEWLIFSAPNGLWLFSFAGLMMYLWGQEQFAAALAWTFALWVVSISSELLQSVHFLSGVFDINDVFAYTTGFLAYFVLMQSELLNEQ